jgi:hypothetical protein
VSVSAKVFAGALAMVFVLLVAACDKERCVPPPQTVVTSDQSADLRKAAENSARVSASNPDSVRFRGVQVWPQAVKNQFAVCGQANVSVPAATPMCCSSSSSPQTIPVMIPSTPSRPTPA